MNDKFTEPLGRLRYAVDFFERAVAYFRLRDPVEISLDVANMRLVVCYWWFGQAPADAVETLQSEMRMAAGKLRGSRLDWMIVNNNQIQITLE
jgi:hypothetical protein